MSVPLYVGNIPNRLTGPETFSADTDIYHAWLPTAITAWNADIAALNTNDTRDTSTSSVSIGTGTKVFTVSAGKSFSAGQWLTISNTSSPTDQMIANVTSYSGTTLTVTVPANGVFGSGTFAAWTIALTAAPTTQISPALDVYSKAETPQIHPITATVASNALTATINPTRLDFRNTTLTNGAVSSVVLSAATSLVVPNTATLGTTNAIASRLVLLAINNAGTIEPAIVNLAGGVDLSETGLITTVALSTGSDIANVVYSTTARTNVAYRVVGIIDITQTTAGTWATAPSLVQGAGGQAVAAMSSLGYGQTWQNVTASRSSGTTYYNTTGKPIVVSVWADGGAGNLYAIVGGVQCALQGVNASNLYGIGLSVVVPSGMSYSVTFASVNKLGWTELR